MKIFLAVYFLIYGSMHAYFFFRLKGAYTLPGGWNVGLILLLILMVTAPILVRVLEQTGWEVWASLLSYMGYTWMGVIFLFVSASLVLDVIRFPFYFTSLRVPPRALFLFPLAIAVMFYVYGYFEAKHIRIERLTVTSPRIPPEVGTIRLVQISDVHIGLIVRGKRLERIVNLVKKTHPDILVSTGDLVDGQIDSLRDAVTLWEGIKPRYGKFAVTGNHEFYAGIDQALTFTQESGFHILRGEAVIPVRGLRIAGVDDPTGRYLDTKMGQVVSERGPEFTILLTHQPLWLRDVTPFDLQLAGHTHAGQLFPFSLITALYFKRQAGLYTLEDGARLYISRGTGTWGPPIRIFAPPEITVFELRHGPVTGSEHF